MSISQKILYWYYRLKLQDGKLGKVLWWLLVVSFFGVLAFNLKASYEYRLERVQSYAQLNTVIVGELIANQLFKLDMLDKHVDHGISMKRDQRGVENPHTEFQPTLDKELKIHQLFVDAIGVYDLNGELIISSGPVQKNVAHEEAIKHLTSKHIDRAFVKPFNVDGPDFYVGVARKTFKKTKTGDVHDGYVIASISLKKMSEPFNKLNATTKDIFQVRTADDNTLVLRYPFDNELIGKQVPYSKFDRRIFFGEKHGVDNYTTVRDQSLKVVAFEQIHDCGLVSIAMIDPTPFFLSYTKELIFSVMLIVLALFFIFT